MFEAVTSCPACGSSFRVTEKQLLLAEGSVRCGACRHFFQAEDFFVSPMLDMTEFLAIKHDYWSHFEAYASHLMPVNGELIDRLDVIGILNTRASGAKQVIESSERDLGAATVSIVNHHVNNAIDAADDKDVVSIWYPNEKKLFGDPQSLVKILEGSIFSKSKGFDSDGLRFDEAIDFEEIESHPSIFGQARKTLNLQFSKWLVAILALVSLLFLQYGYLRMDQFVHELQYRSYYEVTCRYFGCDLPEFYDPSLLEVRELLVRSHQSEKDALVLDALLRNSGEYRQFFPGLRLRFFDLEGNIVASRVFKVKEYLGGEMRGLKFIPANTEVRFSLEIVDPGARALGYQMDVIPYGTPE